MQIEILFNGKWSHSDTFDSLHDALTVALLKPTVIKWRILNARGQVVAVAI